MLRILDAFDMGGKSILSDPLLNSFLSFPVHVCRLHLSAGDTRGVTETRYFPSDSRRIDDPLGSLLTVLYPYRFLLRSRLGSHVFSPSPIFMGEYMTLSEKTLKVEDDTITTKVWTPWFPDSQKDRWNDQCFAEERTCHILYRDVVLVDDRYPFEILLLDKPLEDPYRPLQECSDANVVYQSGRLSGIIVTET